MSSIVLGMGNGAVMFGDRDASNVPMMISFSR